MSLPDDGCATNTRSREHSVVNEPIVWLDPMASDKNGKPRPNGKERLAARQRPFRWESASAPATAERTEMFLPK
jgi:hypothetical protein